MLRPNTILLSYRDGGQHIYVVLWWPPSAVYLKDAEAVTPGLKPQVSSASRL